MKQWIGVGVAAILLLAVAGRNVYEVFAGIDREIQSYVSNLNYDFKARVDSVVSLKKGGGYLICKITSGRCSRSREDSLNEHLTNFKRIRFLHFRSDDQFLIMVGGKKFRAGDSIVVNSQEDKFQVYRSGENILNAKISQSTRHKVSFAFWIKD